MTLSKAPHLCHTHAPPQAAERRGRTHVVLHRCFIIQKNPDIYILTIFIFHMAGEGMGLELRRDGEVMGHR